MMLAIEPDHLSKTDQVGKVFSRLPFSDIYMFSKTYHKWNDVYYNWGRGKFWGLNLCRWLPYFKWISIVVFLPLICLGWPGAKCVWFDGSLKF